MHLTNVAVQKQSDNYDEERGGKYLLDKLRLYILSKFGEEASETCFF
jgi:tubulin polyglutamylase TTLL9